MRIAVVGGGLAGLAAAIECADAGRRRDALRGALAARRRDVLLRAQRPRARQRPARRASLLHRVPRLPAPARRRAPAPAAAAPARARPPRGQAPGAARAHGAPRPAPPRGDAAALRAARRSASASRRRAPRPQLGKLDPDDPALDEQTFADWLRAHGQSENAIDALWNLIALPTLNLPADEASLAGAVKVFRTGLLDSRRRLRHRHPGGAVPPAPRRAGRRGARAGRRPDRDRARPVRSVTAERRLVLDDGSDERRRRDPRRPARVRRRARAAGAVDAEALAGARHEPDRQPAHPLRPARCSTSRSRPRVDSPVQWIFDRTSASGAREGQLVAVSLSHAVDEIGASVAELRDRYLPALERLLPAARGAEVLDFAVTHEPRATFRVAPGHPAGSGPAPARPSRASTSPARGRTPAGRRRWRAPCGAASRRRARPLAELGEPRSRDDRLRRRRSGRVTVTADRAIDAGQAPSAGRPPPAVAAAAQGWWKGELETNVTIDAEDLFLRHFLGLLEPKAVEGTANWIRGQQRPDGSWATYFGGPGDLSTTVEAYVGLRLAGDPAGRRAHGARGRVRPRGRRRRAEPRLHADVALAARPLVVEGGADAAARADPAPGAGAALDLRVRLLGTPDDRRALGRHGARALARRSASASTSCARAARLPVGRADDLWGRAFVARRPRRPRLRPPTGRPAAPARAPDRRALDRRAAGARRLVGRDPAAVGLVDRRAARARLPARPSRARAGARRARQLHDRRREGPARRGLPVARLGHGARGDRAARRRPRPGATRRSSAPASGSSRRRSARAGDWAVRRPELAAGRLPVRVRERELPRRRRHGRHRARAAARRARPDRRGRPRPRLDARHAEPLGRLRRLRRRQREPPRGEARVLRLRRRHRPAELGRHRARARDARPRGPRRRAARAPARSTGSSASRSATARGSAAGARTTSTAPAPSSRRSPPAGSPSTRASPPRSAGSSGCRTPTVGSARISVPTATAPGAAAASRRPRRPPGRSSACTPAGAGDEPRRRARSSGSSRPSSADGGWDEPYYTGTGFPGDFYLNYHLYRDVFPVMALGRILGART